MAIKRIVVEVSPIERPFKEGETLFSYAQRILGEDGLKGEVQDMSATVDILQDMRMGMATTFICVGERVEIEVRTEAMAR